MDELRPERLSHLSGVLLRPVLLGHLLSTSAYGYELRGRLLALGVECDLGTVYRALNVMEAEGLLLSSWERSACGRSRRRYALSEAGVQMVESYVGAVEQLVAVAGAFIEMHHAAAGGGGASLDGDGGGDTVAVTHDSGAPRILVENNGDLAPRAARSPDGISLTGTTRRLLVLRGQRHAGPRVGALGAT